MNEAQQKARVVGEPREKAVTGAPGRGVQEAQDGALREPAGRMVLLLRRGRASPQRRGD